MKMEKVYVIAFEGAIYDSFGFFKNKAEADNIVGLCNKVEGNTLYEVIELDLADNKQVFASYFVSNSKKEGAEANIYFEGITNISRDNNLYFEPDLETLCSGWVGVVLDTEENMEKEAVSILENFIIEKEK